MEVCIHEFPIGQCSHCKAPPAGINKTVYVTKGGMAFHNDPKCETLNSGQAEAESKGLDIHPINPIGWGDAFDACLETDNWRPFMNKDLHFEKNIDFHILKLAALYEALRETLK